jgi:hypothetical protein
MLHFVCASITGHMQIFTYNTVIDEPRWEIAHEQLGPLRIYEIDPKIARLSRINTNLTVIHRYFDCNATIFMEYR